MDYNHKIVLEEVNVDEFAVKLMMSDTMPPMDTFRGETQRYLQYFEGVRGVDIKLYQLIDKNNRVTFVRGIAGMGKSVLVKQLTYSWAKGELFQDIQLCITFECRELNYFVASKGNHCIKDEIICNFLNEKFSYDSRNAKGVLFVIDGLDELYDIYNEDSIIGQLLDLTKSKYTESKVIITGRPHIEHMLLKHGKQMGGLRKVEIHGLGDEQIEEYINKFALSEEHIAKINRAKNSSKHNLKILHVPQFLNSFCCIAIFAEGKKIQNETELYCWTIYLLLKQHAEKEGASDKKVTEIFNEFSRDLLVLSKICHELLSKNTIIFEGNINLQFDSIGKGNKFLKGLFVDVSDNFKLRKQFKHLTLMEFLSALYVCTTENPTKIIKLMLENGLYQALFFMCQLISGIMYDGIIKEMLANAGKLEKTACDQFLSITLNLAHECINDVNSSFEFSIDTIMSLLNNNAITKEFVLSVVSKLKFVRVGFQSVKFFCIQTKLIEMMNHLINEFECNETELQKAFENVKFGAFRVDKFDNLNYAKYLAYVDEISFYNMETTVKVICNRIHQFFQSGKCKSIWIWDCKLKDEFSNDEKMQNYKLQWLGIDSCKLNKLSFINIWKWVLASSVEHVELRLTKIEWWQELVDAIVREKKHNHARFTLTKLVIWKCSAMNDEMKMKVINFILLQNFSNCIIICKLI